MRELSSARALAQDVLSLTNQERPPIKLEAILACFRDVRLTESQLEGDGVFVDLGALGAEILIKKGVSNFRKRFTTAHELGHYLLSRSKVSAIDAAFVERWCDVFAVNLLMPESLVREYVAEAEERPRQLGWRIYEGNVVFGVSKTAFLARYSEVSKSNLYVFDELGPDRFRMCNSAMRAGNDLLLWSSNYLEVVRDAIATTKPILKRELGELTVLVQKLPTNYLHRRWMVVLRSSAVEEQFSDLRRRLAAS